MKLMQCSFPLDWFFSSGRVQGSIKNEATVAHANKPTEYTFTAWKLITVVEIKDEISLLALLLKIAGVQSIANHDETKGHHHRRSGGGSSS